MNGAVSLASCTSSISSGSTCVDALRPGVDVGEVGHEAACVDRGAGGEAFERRRTGGERLLGQLVGLGGGGREDRVRGDRTLERQRVRRRSCGRRSPPREAAVGQGSEFGIHQSASRQPGERRTVCAALLIRMSSGPCAATDSARAITWAGSRRSMPTTRRRSIQSRGVGEAGEPADGVARETGGDRGVRAVAQQPQRDVHADLGAAAGEQRPLAGEVGAGVALRVAHRRAVRAELVVERVDERVVLLADVAGARFEQHPGALLRVAELEIGTPRVSSSIRSGAPVAVAAMIGLVVGLDARARLELAHTLDFFEHRRGRIADRNEDGVGVVKLGDVGEHPQGHLELGGIDLVGAGLFVGWHLRLSHPPWPSTVEVSSRSRPRR